MWLAAVGKRRAQCRPCRCCCCCLSFSCLFSAGWSSSIGLPCGDSGLGCWLCCLLSCGVPDKEPNELCVCRQELERTFGRSLEGRRSPLVEGVAQAQRARPPLKEAFFTATLPPPYQKELLWGCPGLMVLSHLMLAEARLYIDIPEEAGELVARAGAMMALPELQGPHLDGIQNAWPLAAALERFERTAQRLAVERQTPMSVDIVLPRCREDLLWLEDRGKLEMFPDRTRIFVYEKCKEVGHVPNITTRNGRRATVIHSMLDDAADPKTGMAARRDECTAYLAHVVRHYHSGFADFTLFLHGDPSDHTPFGLLNMFLKGIAMGTMGSVEFLHLGSPRLVHTANPCQAGLFEAAMGRPQRGPLSTYCCSQFAVSKERMLSRSREDYARMLRLVDGTIPDLCDRVGPAYEAYRGARLSHCYFFEFMWHIVFGESEELALRADDERLPIALRLKDNEQNLPSTWRSYLSPFISGQVAFQRQSHDQWFAQLVGAPPVESRQQVNYGDADRPFEDER